MPVIRKKVKGPLQPVRPTGLDIGLLRVEGRASGLTPAQVDLKERGTREPESIRIGTAATSAELIKLTTGAGKVRPLDVSDSVDFALRRKLRAARILVNLPFWTPTDGYRKPGEETSVRSENEALALQILRAQLGLGPDSSPIQVFRALAFGDVETGPKLRDALQNYSTQAMFYKDRAPPAERFARMLSATFLGNGDPKLVELYASYCIRTIQHASRLDVEALRAGVEPIAFDVGVLGCGPIGLTVVEQVLKEGVTVHAMDRWPKAGRAAGNFPEVGTTINANNRVSQNNGGLPTPRVGDQSPLPGTGTFADVTAQGFGPLIGISCVVANAAAELEQAGARFRVDQSPAAIRELSPPLNGARYQVDYDDGTSAQYARLVIAEGGGEAVGFLGASASDESKRFLDEQFALAEQWVAGEAVRPNVITAYQCQCRAGRVKKPLEPFLDPADGKKTVVVEIGNGDFGRSALLYLTQNGPANGYQLSNAQQGQVQHIIAFTGRGGPGNCLEFLVGIEGAGLLEPSEARERPDGVKAWEGSRVPYSSLAGPINSGRIALDPDDVVSVLPELRDGKPSRDVRIETRQGDVLIANMVVLGTGAYRRRSGQLLSGILPPGTDLATFATNPDCVQPVLGKLASGAKVAIGKQVVVGGVKQDIFLAARAAGPDLVKPDDPRLRGIPENAQGLALLYEPTLLLATGVAELGHVTTTRVLESPPVELCVLTAEKNARVEIPLARRSSRDVRMVEGPAGGSSLLNLRGLLATAWSGLRFAEATSPSLSLTVSQQEGTLSLTLEEGGGAVLAAFQKELENRPELDGLLWLLQHHTGEGRQELAIRIPLDLDLKDSSYSIVPERLEVQPQRPLMRPPAFDANIGLHRAEAERIGKLLAENMVLWITTLEASDVPNRVMDFLAKQTSSPDRPNPGWTTIAQAFQGPVRSALTVWGNQRTSSLSLKVLNAFEKRGFQPAQATVEQVVVRTGRTIGDAAKVQLTDKAGRLQLLAMLKAATVDPETDPIELWGPYLSQELTRRARTLTLTLAQVAEIEADGFRGVTREARAALYFVATGRLEDQQPGTLGGLRGFLEDFVDPDVAQGRTFEREAIQAAVAKLVPSGLTLADVASLRPFLAPDPALDAQLEEKVRLAATQALLGDLLRLEPLASALENFRERVQTEGFTWAAALEGFPLEDLLLTRYATRTISKRALVGEVEAVGIQLPRGFRTRLNQAGINLKAGDPPDLELSIQRALGFVNDPSAVALVRNALFDVVGTLIE